MKALIFKPLLVLLAVLSVLFASSCNDNFEELEKNPNKPSSVPPSLVFNGILNDMFEASWNSAQRYNQFWASNYYYFDHQEYTWTTSDYRYSTTTNAKTQYGTLKNVVKMEEEAKKATPEEAKTYAALGKFFRAYFFTNMTQRVGDIPMTEALKGLDNTTPKYNTQKEVYAQVLTWLEESNNELTALIASGTTTVKGDIYLNGNLKKWQKVVNTYKLRVLISLSKKEGEADLNIKQKFAETIGNATKYPVMTGLADNVQYNYNTSVNKYPFNPGEYGKTALRNNMTAALLTPLRELKDPRLFVFAEPAPAKVADGLSPVDHNAFVGAPSDESLDDMTTKVQKGQYSLINRLRYYGSFTGEPTIQIGYAELCFNIAEGIHRGWATGSAEEFYKKGIQASQSFHGIKEGDNDVFFILKKDGALGEYDKITINFAFATYYDQPMVKYAGSNADGLKQILTQKYIAFFQNSGWEAFYNNRRTGIPKFDVG
ncbi:MAG: SusD/RagB family nutrient-binding outer membrane lipoprotein, partial [Bacteroidota bacterium]